MTRPQSVTSSDVIIPPHALAGTLALPKSAHGLIVFAHGSGSSHLSPRNIAVAKALNGRNFGTFLFDLLTQEEEADRANVFDIPLLAERLIEAWRTDGLGQSWGLFLSSSEEQSHIRHRLRTFNQAKLPDGRMALFRWWDPRVFRVYLPTCNADHLATLFAGVDHYVCENEDGAGFTIYRNHEGTLVREHTCDPMRSNR